MLLEDMLNLEPPKMSILFKDAYFSYFYAHACLENFEEFVVFVAKMMDDLFRRGLLYGFGLISTDSCKALCLGMHSSVSLDGAL